MDEARDAEASFYSEHYHLLAGWQLKVGKKIELGIRDQNICRFCGKRSPEVTFALEAHAIPELLGNKSLFSHYECDTCNTFFGSGIENDFGNWSKPMRTLQRIRGKRGVPTLKNKASGWRIECDADGQVNVNHNHVDDVFTINESEQLITFKLKRDRHIPIAVLKAFVKMGLSIMPDAEMSAFTDAVAWIMNPVHGENVELLAPVYRTICAGPVPQNWLSAVVIRRKPNKGGVPYAFFILGCGSETFQVMLPCPEHDSGAVGGTIPLFPAVQAHSGLLLSFDALDLNGLDVVTDGFVSVVMAYDERIPVSPGPVAESEIGKSGNGAAG